MKKRKGKEKSGRRRETERRPRRSVWWVPVAIAAAAGLYYVVSTSSLEDRGRPTRTTTPAASPGTDNSRSEDVPPFHTDPEDAKPFPSTLDPARFHIPFVARAYAIAQEIPDVLAQQPCYCYCQGFGHGSLLDCYTSDHGAG